MRQFISLLALMAFIPASAAVLFEDESTSRIRVTEKNGHIVTTKTETTYVPGYLRTANMLFKVVKSETSIEGAEGSDGKVKVEAFGTTNRPYDTRKFSLTQKGHEFKLLEEFIQITRFGCCGDYDYMYLFNNKTGKPIKVALGGIRLQARSWGSGLSPRYLAVSEDREAPQKHKGKTWVGTISYFDQQKVISRARIYADLSDDLGTDLTRIEAVVGEKDRLVAKGTVDLWRPGLTTAAEVYRDFGVKGKVFTDNGVESFTVRIVNDEISLEASEATERLTIEVVHVRR